MAPSAVLCGAVGGAATSGFPLGSVRRVSECSAPLSREERSMTTFVERPTREPVGSIQSLELEITGKCQLACTHCLSAACPEWLSAG
ncbi:hypothetical protein GCM10010433_73910 [Streptomyces pulveraceus]